MSGVHRTVSLTRRQTTLGWLYLPLYLCGWALILQALEAAGIPELDGVTRNSVYYALNLLFTLIVFGPWLVKSLRRLTKKFWLCLQTLVLALAACYAGMWLVGRLLPGVVVFNNDTVTDYYYRSPAVMILCSVILAPLVEETLLRGVVFGSLRQWSRIAAYGVSVILFAFVHVWQYAGGTEPAALLSAAAIYVPAALALAWSYDKSGTIWVPILAHAVVNAVSFGILTLS